MALTFVILMSGKPDLFAEAPEASAGAISGSADKGIAIAKGDSKDELSKFLLFIIFIPCVTAMRLVAQLGIAHLTPITSMSSKKRDPDTPFLTIKVTLMSETPARDLAARSDPIEFLRSRCGISPHQFLR